MRPLATLLLRKLAETKGNMRPSQTIADSLTDRLLTNALEGDLASIRLIYEVVENAQGIPFSEQPAVSLSNRPAVEVLDPDD
jgi:hypothetical protein